MIKKILNNSGINFFGKIFGRLIQFSSDILIIRYFSDPSVHGIYVTVWSIIRLVWIIIPLGLHNAIVNFATTHYKKDENLFYKNINLILSLTLIIGISFFCMFWFSIEWISNKLYDEAIRIPLMITAFSFPLIALIRNLNSLTTIKKTLLHKTISEEIIWYLTFMIGLIYVIIFDKSSHFIYFFILLSFIMSLVYSIISTANIFTELRYKFSFDSSKYKMYLKYSLPTLFAGIFNFTTLHINRLMVGSLIGLSYSSFYHRAAILTLFFPLVIQSFVGILNPIIRENYVEGNIDKVQKIYNDITKVIILINLPISLALIFCGHQLLEIFFGVEHLEDIVLSLKILSLNFLFISFAGPVVSVFIMCDMQQKWMKINFYSFLIGITSSYILISNYGIIGAAISTFISANFLYFYSVYTIKFKLSLYPIDKYEFINILISLLIPISIYLSIDTNNIYYNMTFVLLNTLIFYLGFKLFNFEKIFNVFLNNRN